MKLKNNPMLNQEESVIKGVETTVKTARANRNFFHGLKICKKQSGKNNKITRK